MQKNNLLYLMLLVITILCISPDCFAKKLKVYYGFASYYGFNDNYNNKQMANGKILNAKTMMIAAHYNLPLNTKLTVINLLNHKKVYVTITDRMPYNKKRIIDLSYLAAKKLNMIKQGVVPVKITIISNHTFYKHQKIHHKLKQSHY